jgi:hypothetical protein
MGAKYCASHDNYDKQVPIAAGDLNTAFAEPIHARLEQQAKESRLKLR